MKSGNRSIWKKIIASPISVVVLVVLVFVLARAVFNIYNKAQLSENRLAQAQAGLSNLTQRQKDIAGKVEALSTDQGIEAEIRTRYHAVKAGEQVAVIVDDSQTANVRNAATSTSAATSSPSWWRRWLRVFGL